MRRHFRLQGLPGPSALAIGNFDGFHAGHRRVLRLLAAQARRRGLQAAVLTFHPHPRVFLGQDVRLIQTDAQRLETLSRQELDHLFCVDFAAGAGIPAADFVSGVLLSTLRARLLVVGSDFRFGRGREGDLAFLRRAVAGRCAVVAAPTPQSTAGAWPARSSAACWSSGRCARPGGCWGGPTASTASSCAAPAAGRSWASRP